ncbi:MAG: toprim domain-containing protein [Verrucomicrobiaceae bacterium]
MAKPFIDFTAIKAAVSFQQVLEHYGFTASMRSTRNGDGLEGPCPIHEGTSQDVFKVTLSKNCWFCHNSSCKCGGNHLDFVAKMENCDAHEAALKIDQWFNLGLAGKAGSPPPRRDDAPSRSVPPVQQPSSAANLPQTNSEDEGSVSLGCNNPLQFELKNLKTDHAYMTERGLSPETASTFGLGFCAKGTMSGRIVIPIHNGKGELVGYSGRWPGEPPEERPKYKLPAGFKKSAEVFNLHRALQESPEQPLIIVEGFFDVMKLWQLGFKRAVSIMGSSLSKVQEELIRQATNSDSRITLMLDEDNAGRKGREQALLRLATFAYVHVVVFPAENMQPDHLSAEELATLLGA